MEPNLPSVREVASIIRRDAADSAVSAERPSLELHMDLMRASAESTTASSAWVSCNTAERACERGKVACAIGLTRTRRQCAGHRKVASRESLAYVVAFFPFACHERPGPQGSAGDQPAAQRPEGGGTLAQRLAALPARGKKLPPIPGMIGHRARSV